LKPEEILACCETGHDLGFRTFVLQGGEDAYYTDELLSELITEIKIRCNGCAVTLSLGERSHESYKTLKQAGADRYFLRHETANPEHYWQLHPEDMQLENRKACLFALRDLGYQVGSGFMVGSPGQTAAHIVEDIRFLQELQPDMIGIGPFLTHQNTPFKNSANGSPVLTLRLIAILRLLFPATLIPATTALVTASPDGRELGLKAGANVLMPNLSPVPARKLYTLYDNKAHTGVESAGNLAALRKQVKRAGYHIVAVRGDAKTY
jgi:biotin synthase